MAEPTAEHPYHHGNVKQALLDVAMALMEKESVDQLSLRRLAKEVGVTPSAVYNHFPDKHALMLAIKTRAFEALNDYFDENCTDTADPEAGLEEMYSAYYAFSRRSPACFAVLFSPFITGSPVPNSEFLHLSCRTINRLRGLILGVYQKYEVRCTDTMVVNSALLAWTQLHGLVILKDSGSIQAAVGCQGWPESCSLQLEADVDAILQEMIRHQVVGIQQRRSTLDLQ
ncbi:MAG: hypothetical protein RLZZ385_2183 [Pseudomonadota bacterium]|jgi:AcrR family transcriptional regulator